MWSRTEPSGLKWNIKVNTWINLKCVKHWWRHIVVKTSVFSLCLIVIGCEYNYLDVISVFTYSKKTYSVYFKIGKTSPEIIVQIIFNRKVQLQSILQSINCYWNDKLQLKICLHLLNGSSCKVEARAERACCPYSGPFSPTVRHWASHGTSWASALIIALRN